MATPPNNRYGELPQALQRRVDRLINALASQPGDAAVTAVDAATDMMAKPLFTKAEKSALYAVFEHGDARPWEKAIATKRGGLPAWLGLKVWEAGMQRIYRQETEARRWLHAALAGDETEG